MTIGSGVQIGASRPSNQTQGSELFEESMNRLRELSPGQTRPLIAPSMLKCDYGNLQREVEMLEAGGCGPLHFDVMDGHFVPNLSYGAMLIRALRKRTELAFDAHLMISEPARYVDEYIAAGCDAITFHMEAERNPLPLLKRIREAGVLAGLAFNPGTAVSEVEPYLENCDLVLVMSVEPGFGGQAFLPSSLDKLRELCKSVSPGTILSVDGGIGPGTIELAAEAGANLFVVGSAVFDAADYGEAIAQLKERAAGFPR